MRVAFRVASEWLGKEQARARFSAVKRIIPLQRTSLSSRPRFDSNEILLSIISLHEYNRSLEGQNYRAPRDIELNSDENPTIKYNW